ncbi:MAG: hypothetical protein COZ49_03470 [Candidatus Yonathbacteria bacterium CG_4_10_14_3_um_filter_47_65]|nr:MAG: hypothetical protein COX54_03515 [Candidatus Yonathbacteria bacterium CG23_combo_of_CG06-09_8_20_14_all_46_18]PIQ32954.1 MAG: hypothetical protein COW61_00575 [Candidatus Yonathbacteria bacterium CG17_big_fil_post_rev_8_21_14_2_50_46_19]PIX56175.1 MAG: hypothetical protein COZ49_03470 [Candidatus Yonathbacteria bacterium CG_4_10_14_3_um_filter_47_65]PJC67645.1 MAG: hypothetical protein CO016_00800 [Candidatus Yonathbacteria bacterium CG_4_8_14_3_um_filter_46_25]
MNSSETKVLLSFIAEGLMLFDEKGKIMSVNPHATLLLDYTSEELIGRHIDKTFSIYLDKKFLSEQETITYVIFEQGRTFSTPHGRIVYFESQSGRKFPVFVSAKAISINGKRGGILVFRDITDQKELEDYKINTAKKLATLTPILQRTATGVFSTKIKIPREEDEFTELLVGLALMIDDLEEMEKTRKESEERRVEAVKKAEGQKRTMTEEYSKKLENDVREKTEELRRAKVHTEAVIENLTSGLVEYSSDFTVLRVNRAAEDILGIKREDVVGRKISPKDIETPGMQSLSIVSYPALSDVVRKVKSTASGIKEGVSVNEVVIHYPFDREVQVITAPIIGSESDTRKGFIKVLRDITRERIISRGKSEFISIAAHQLRTPLSAVKWVISLVINGDLGLLNPAQRKLLERGYETNEKMITLVNDMLNVARIEDGRFGYKFSKNDILKTISLVVDNLKVVAKEKGVILKFETPPDPIEEFMFDPDKLSLAIQNLIDNAVKYTNAGGKVVVMLSKKDSANIEVKVSDEGVGIPESQINRLFSKFFRAKNVIHLQTEGSGLGLFIVKNIITRHGGTIKVESKESKGSTFSFTLPLDESFVPKEGEISEY